MNCHALLERETPEIRKLKDAVEQGRPLQWIKVHNLPDFVYFNHSQHVLAAVDCQQCHGAVEQMAEVYQAEPLTMGWCLDCHERRRVGGDGDARRRGHCGPTPNRRSADSTAASAITEVASDERQRSVRIGRASTSCGRSRSRWPARRREFAGAAARGSAPRRTRRRNGRRDFLTLMGFSLGAATLAPARARRCRRPCRSSASPRS